MVNKRIRKSPGNRAVPRPLLLAGLLGGILCGVLSGCRQEGKPETSAERFYTPPEQYFVLDSTVMGISTVATGLDVPWEITWGPDGWIWYSEIGGTIGKLNPATGEKKVLLELGDVFTRTTPGLLGMAVHPDQEHSPWLFLLYTQEKAGDTLLLNVMRYTVDGDTCRDPKLLMEVPGGLGHNGSRIRIGPDGYLYISTGEASRADKSQDIRDPGGKVLRIRMDGSVPPDNPFAGNPVWAWGFRNPQGLVLTGDGRIYLSDHGEATDDEVNRVVKGGNYGWPDVRGFCDTEKEQEYCADSVIQMPLKAWTPTIAPAGLDFYDSETIPEWRNSLLLATLKGSALRVLHLNRDGSAVDTEKILFEGLFGRIRDVCISPGGDVYISTSNRDWNPLGVPRDGDDRIIRLFRLEDGRLPDSIPEYKPGESASGGPGGWLSGDRPATLSGEKLYLDYCSACHQANGKGAPDAIPALTGNPLVSGDPEQLIRIVLQGRPGAGEPMPSFAFLDDEEIAAVLSYVRSRFGPHSKKILPGEVKRLR